MKEEIDEEGGQNEDAAPGRPQRKEKKAMETEQGQRMTWCNYVKTDENTPDLMRGSSGAAGFDLTTSTSGKIEP